MKKQNNLDAIYESLQSLTTKVERNALLAPYTTFKIGGPADILVAPKTVGELQAIMTELHHAGLEPLVLGCGSNVLIRDGGVRGVVIVLNELQHTIHCEGNRLIAGAGFTLKEISERALAENLTGLEFAIGIPGTLGGAVFMNAGAYDGEMKHIVHRVDSVDNQGQLHSYRGCELDFAYRHSIFHDNHEIIVEVEMELAPGNPADIKAKMDDLTFKRESKQPLEYASAGSTFKRPPGLFAGTLIDQTGLKGLAVGDAEVSTKHAGFVINKGKATAHEVLSLIKEVQARVKAAHGVNLETEVRIIGEGVAHMSEHPTIDIVDVKEEDLDELSQLCRDTFRETFRHDNTEEQLEAFFREAYSLDVLANELADPESKYLFVTVDGEKVGYLKVNWGEAQTERELEHAFEIQRLYILQAYQGLKLGRLLFEKALSMAAEGGFDWAWLGVWEKNFKAQRFYESYGFHKFSEHAFPVSEDKIDVDYLFRKPLKEGLLAE